MYSKLINENVLVMFAIKSFIFIGCAYYVLIINLATNIHV